MLDNTTITTTYTTASDNDSTAASTGSPGGDVVGVDHADALLVHPYLRIYPPAAVTYVIAVSMALVLGTAGNLAIIGTYAVAKSVRILGNEFILNLAIADLCVTAIADPLCILGVTHGKRFFDDRPILCEIIACLCLSSCFCAFFNLGLITLNRYVYICHYRYYNTLFSRPKIIAMCIGSWFLALLLEMPNFIGWGDHGFDLKQLQCIWMRTASVSYTILVGIGLITLPLLLMTAAYTRIFLFILASKRKVFAHAVVTTCQSRKRELRETIKSSRSLFIVTLAFLVCWTPYTVTLLVDLEDRLPVSVHLWVTFLAHLHSALNFTIYAMTNANFRQGYLIFFRFLCGLSISGHASTSTVTTDDPPKTANSDQQKLAAISGSTQPSTVSN